MNKPPFWSIARIISLSGVSIFAMLCLTAVGFQEGDLRIYFEAPGGIRVNASVNKGRSSESEALLLPEEEPADRCPPNTENKLHALSEELTDHCLGSDPITPSEMP